MNQLKSLLADNRTTLLVFICIVAVYGLSYYKRQATYTHWLENRDDYVVENVTPMTTLDAYFWLKMAREIHDGKLQKGHPDPLKGYPDLEDYPDSPSLLAHLINFAAGFTGGDFYRAGIWLVPLLSGLFVFPLFLYCHSLGFGASAVLGGLIGTFSVSYYSRTDLGYVDTDMLNTFFPLMVSAFVVLIGRERPQRTNILLALGSGAAMHLFIWWYQQPAFFLAYLPFIALYLLLLRLPWRQTGWLLLAFTLATGPHHVLQSAASLAGFFNAYFFPKVSGQISWPDILTTITEAQQHTLLAKLDRVHGYLPIALAGLAGMICLCVLRWKRMVPLAPLLLLGVWSLFGPRRFTMYLAPFIGIGVGVLIELLARQVGARVGLRPLATSATALALMAGVFFSTTGYTAYNIIPGPIPSTETIRAFLDIKKRVPRNAAMFTWWDQGYPLMEIGEFATYHDGALHGYARTTLIGKALTSSRQEDLVSLIAYLEKYGFNTIESQIRERNLSGEQLMQQVFGYPPRYRGGKVHVLYVESMLNSFPGASVFGTWDFSRQSSEPMRYEYLACFSMVDNVMNCKGAKVDLNRGIITDGSFSTPLKAALFVNDGYVVDRADYDATDGFYLQILMKKGKIDKIQVIEERLFRTNFNQQYLLGNYDRRYFEEVYNNFPVARVFRVRTAVDTAR